MFDHEVRRYLDFLRRAAGDFKFGNERLMPFVREVEEFLAIKQPGEVDPRERCCCSSSASARSRPCPRSRRWA